MNGRVWERPITIVQKFVPNEYASGCGDSGTMYYFECNAGDRNKEYAIKDSGGRVATISGMYMDGKRYYYHPCGETHEADSDSGFLTGYHLDDPDTWRDENIAVIIWTEYGRDVHCTTKLDMDSWETVKS